MVEEGRAGAALVAGQAREPPRGQGRQGAQGVAQGVVACVSVLRWPCSISRLGTGT